MLTPEQIVLKYLAFAERIGAGYWREHQTLEREDVVQEARLGLARAANTYDPAKMPTSPEAWIRKRVVGSLKDKYGKIDQHGGGDNRKYKDIEKPKKSEVEDLSAIETKNVTTVTPKTYSLASAADSLECFKMTLLRLLRRVQFVGVYREVGERESRWIIAEHALPKIRRRLKERSRKGERGFGGGWMARTPDQLFPAGADEVEGATIMAKLGIGVARMRSLIKAGRLPRPIQGEGMFRGIMRQRFARVELIKALEAERNRWREAS